MGTRNWAGNVTFRAARVESPSSIDELRALVTAHRRVRVVGSGHSFSAIADTDGLLLSLAGLPRIIELDTGNTENTDRPAVWVDGGIRYSQLCRQLDDLGYALHNLGSLPHISVAGSIATGTHGSGDANGNLATAVSALEIVTADGDLVELSRERDGDLFAGAVVALGSLGVVTRLRLDVRPTFDVRQQVYEDLAFDTVLERFDDIFGSAYSVSAFTTWRRRAIDLLWLKRHAADPWDPHEPAFGARPADGPRHPVPGMPTEACTDQLGAAGPWYARLPHFRPDFTPSVGDELQSEYLIPRRHATSALRELAGIRDRIAPALQVCEIRTMAGDELWTSPSHGRPTVGLHFTWVPDEATVLPVVTAIEERLAPFEARPHWGKLFTVAPETVRSRYPRIDDFAGLARRFDPDGKFRNDFVDRYVF
ncbi:MAG TPA: FAD-binding protein [Actinopolymorphaceae bacterium]